MIMIVCLGLSVVVGGSGLVALGGGALAMQTWQASQREAALTNVLHTAMSRAASVDASFHNIEGLTTSMAYAARASTHTAPRKLPYKVAQAEPARKHDTGRHGRASVDYASVGTRVGSERNETDLSRMANLGSVMTQAMVSVQTRDARKIDGADRAKRIGDAEAPITWVKIGLVNGTLGRAPGTTAYDPRLSDFKAEPWFTAPKKRRGASWGEPTMDPLGLGQVVPCSVAWFTNNGAIEGVAAMEVSVHWMKKRISSFKGATVYLIDKENRVMVSTKTDATRKPTFETLPAPQHIEAITHDQAGWHEASDGSLAVWSPMKTTGWTWVAIAPSKMLRARVNSTH